MKEAFTVDDDWHDTIFADDADPPARNYYDEADGDDDAMADDTDMANGQDETYTDYRGVARNLAQVVPDGRAIFERQVKAHTLPLDDALDALPPGVKAWLYLQRSKLVLADRTMVQMGNEIEALEKLVHALRHDVALLAERGIQAKTVDPKELSTGMNAEEEAAMERLQGDGHIYVAPTERI